MAITAPPVPTSPAPAPPLPAARARAVVALQRQGALVALAAVCLFGAARYPEFATPENLLNVMRQNSMLGLVALGMTLVVLTRGIDLSVGALLAVSGVAAGAASAHGSLAAAAAGVGAAAALGTVNGLAITRARIQPFVATLAMMIAARGAVLAATREESVELAPAAGGLLWIGRGRLLGVPVPVLVLAAAYLVGWAALRSTRFGRYVYAAGDDEDAARLLGLPVDRVVVGTYALSGALAGLAGLVLAARLGAGQPVAGAGWELDAIAAVVVGGTLLTGGQGGAGATLVGVLLLGTIFNLLNLEGDVSPWWQWVLRGVFLLGVVLVQARLQHPAAGVAGEGTAASGSRA